MKLLSRWFRRAPAAPSWIEPAGLAARLKRDPALLVLDVRGPDEFDGPLGHIGSAVNVPMIEVPARLTELCQADRPIVVVCKTDRRSSIAALQLREVGAEVSVLRGGMEEWRRLGLPVA